LGSLYTRLFGVVYVTRDDFHDGSEKETGSVHLILRQSWEKCYKTPRNDSTRTGVYMREGTTSRVTVADRPYGKFYDFYNVSPENFGSTLVFQGRLSGPYSLATPGQGQPTDAGQESSGLCFDALPCSSWRCSERLNL